MNVIISDNTFDGGSLGISWSLIHTVSNNSFTNSKSGLEIHSAYIENLINNAFESSSMSIGVNSSSDTYSSYFNNFANNTINGLEIGFYENEENITISYHYAQLFVFNSSLVKIVNQTISYTIVGVKILYCSNFSLISSNFSSCETAVEISHSSNGNINNNTLSNNKIGVVFKYFSENLVIQFNSISNSLLYAILADSSFCTMTHNNFLFNAAEEISQAFDNGLNNDWDYNYWSDWIGTGDYQIDGLGPVYHYDHNPLASSITF